MAIVAAVSAKGGHVRRQGNIYMGTGATRLSFREPRRRRWPLLMSALALGAIGLGFTAYIQPPQGLLVPSSALPADDTARPPAERTRAEGAGVMRLALPVDPDAGNPESVPSTDWSPTPQPDDLSVAFIEPLPEPGLASDLSAATHAEILSLPAQDQVSAPTGDSAFDEPSLPDDSLLSAVAAAEASDDLVWDEHVVVPGDTLSKIFSRLEIHSQLHPILALGEETADLQRLYPGERLRAGKRDGQFEALIYEPRSDHYLKITRAEADGAFIVEQEDHDLVTQRRVVRAEIQQSLFLDGARAGLADATLIQIADIFGWDIDFAWDIREGDRVTVVHERIYKDGEYLRDGPVLAAEFQNRGRTLRALRFAVDGQKPGYFTPEGNSLRQAFIRTPVDVGRISSNFGPRKHPVLGYNRQHQGVDYAAPTGTPIRAAGNGRIEHRGTRGGYGKTVIIDHGNNYKTLYAHMNSFRSGHSVGSRVSQGEIIGYVGMTGLATGPHLHYEFHVRNNPVNPVTVELPRAEPLPGKQMEAFRAATAPLLAAIESARDTQLAERPQGTGTR
jgi:murein DD-endopeptidase MepM/ murein hydrolase activator NlpD